MGRHSLILLALLLVFPGPWSAAEPLSPKLQALAECYARPLKDPSLDALSGLSAGLNRYLKLDRVVEASSEINAYEKKVLRKYPQLGLVLRDVRCRSIAISAALCGLDLRLDRENFNAMMQDEETDAIRHFLFTFLLASTQGSELARLYTTAHEGDPAKWDERSLMDIENNMAGAYWVDDIQRRVDAVPLDDQSAAFYAMQALQQGNLLVSKKGSTRCAALEIRAKPVEELLTNLDDYYDWVRATPACRAMPPRKP